MTSLSSAPELSAAPGENVALRIRGRLEAAEKGLQGLTANELRILDQEELIPDVMKLQQQYQAAFQKKLAEHKIEGVAEITDEVDFLPSSKSMNVVFVLEEGMKHELRSAFGEEITLRERYGRSEAVVPVAFLDEGGRLTEEALRTRNLVEEVHREYERRFRKMLSEKGFNYNPIIEGIHSTPGTGTDPQTGEDGFDLPCAFELRVGGEETDSALAELKAAFPKIIFEKSYSNDGKNCIVAKIHTEDFPF